MTWRVEHFDVIDSTNVWLARRAREGAPEGLVARADFQSAGRGRRDRNWEAAPGTSLLSSILLRPAHVEDVAFWAVAAVSISFVEAVEDVAGVRVALKWPNDLVHDAAKLGGVLSEYVVTDQGPAVVVGVGLNLVGDGPAGVAAASVASLGGRVVAPELVLEAALSRLGDRRERLDTPEGREHIRGEYRDRLATLGSAVRVETHQGFFEGVATDIDPRGRLVVSSRDAERVFDVGDVVHLRRS